MRLARVFDPRNDNTLQAALRTIPVSVEERIGEKSMKKIFIAIFCLLFLPCLYAAEKMIDKMDNKELWTKHDHNGDAKVEVSSIKGADDIGHSIKVDYDMKSKDYISIYREFKTIDLTVGNRVQFPIKVEGNRNTFKVMLWDEDDEDAQIKWFALPETGGWTTLGFFLTITNDSGEELGDNIDLNEIAKFQLEINCAEDNDDEGGSGTYYIGPIQIVLSSNISKCSQYVDDFNDNEEETNNLGGENRVDMETTYLTKTNSISNFLTLDYTSGGAKDEIIWLVKLESINVISKDELRFRIKGKNGGEKIGIFLQDTGYSGDLLLLEKDLSETITTDWQWIKIDLDKFKSSDKKTLYELKFVFLKSGEDSIGKNDITIYIDDIQFYAPDKYAGIKGTIDTMDTAFKHSAWTKGGGGVDSVSGVKQLDPEMEITPVDTDESFGKAYQIDYNFHDGKWLYMYRQFGLNLFEYKGFSFNFKGEHDNNNLEVKLGDSDGTIYRKMMYKFTDTDDKWKHVQIDLTKDLEFLITGANDNLNLKSISKIDFTVAKESGGYGYFAIDNVKISDYIFNVAGEGIIKEFKISPNPFSPNEDGFEDEVSFIFKLDKSAKITFYIYDLKGNQVFQEESPGYYAADVYNVTTWSGKNYNKDINKNGLYILKFCAEAKDGDKSDIQSVLSILK